MSHKSNRINSTPFTEYQKEEILHLISVRIETVTEDPESADEFETPASLEALEAKIKAGVLGLDLTEDEQDWLRGELEFHKEKAEHGDPDTRNARAAFVRSIDNALTKIL